MAVTNYYSVAGAIIGEKVAGQPRIDYLTDALGSVTATVDVAASVLNEYRFKPYGAQLARSGTATDSLFTWVGQNGYRQTSNKNSEVYVRARHYGNMQAVWTSVDAYWPRERSYAYTNGMPSTSTDPSGKACSIQLSGTVKNSDCIANCSPATNCGPPTPCIYYFEFKFTLHMNFYGCTNCNIYQWYSESPNQWVED